MAHLPAIDRPSSWLARFAMLISRRRYGKVLSPIRIIYSRVPALLPLTLKIQSIMKSKLHLDDELVTLIVAQASLVNDCSFCRDLHLADAMRKKLGLEKFRELVKFRESEAFSPAEKAVLEYVDEVTRARMSRERTFAEMKKHFSETQIVEITWLIATANYFNLLAKPLGIASDELVSGMA